jgi:hypothetical protein
MHVIRNIVIVILNAYIRYTDHSPNDQSPKDQSPNDQSPKATILRKQPFAERPISENDQSSEDWLLPSWSHNGRNLLQWLRTEKKIVHILPDFLSLLHLIFHLYHRRQVLNYMVRIVITSRVSAWSIVLGLG